MIDHEGHNGHKGMRHAPDLQSGFMIENKDRCGSESSGFVIFVPALRLVSFVRFVVL